MNKIKAFFTGYKEIILIILLSIITYGLFIPWLGLYWDDWTYLWAFKSYGHVGLTDYFSTNRPVYGLLYHLTLPLIGENVLLWHIFGLFWRIVASIVFYRLLTLIWPTRKTLTFIAGLLFAVYPGFLLQPITITFGHFWIMYTIFLLSFCFTVMAWKKPGRNVLYTIIACVLSLINVLGMEYFLPLELVRLVVLFFLVDKSLGFWHKAILAFKRWLPYFVILVAITCYRAFFFSGQTKLYSLSLLDTLNQNFDVGIKQLVGQVVSALYQSTLYAWIQAFIQLVQRFSTNKVYLAVLALSSFTFVILLLISLRYFKSAKESNRIKDNSPWIIALAALLVAGVPFYITLLPVKAEALSSRFTLPFMIGATIILAWVINQIPWRGFQAFLLSALLAGAVGFNLLNTNDFRLRTEENNKLYYQLVWRAPSLKPGTTLVTNEKNVYFTFVALRSELNTIYPHPEGTNYPWIYGRDLALITETPLKKNTTIQVPYLVHDFEVNTNEIAVFELYGNGCLRFLDTNSSHIPMDIEDFAYQEISNADMLNYNPNTPVKLDEALIGPEPGHDWCYYYEKSDLAMQMGDYQAVLQYYQEAQEKSLSPHEGYELLPFVKAMAMANDWPAAITLAQQAIEASPENDDLQPSICQILTGVADQQTGSNVGDALSSLGCSQ